MDRYIQIFFCSFEPLILLHISLIVRIGSELLGSGPARLWGGLFNVIAVILYLGMLASR